MSYKAKVLDKYRNNQYCDIGYDVQNESHNIRFLSVDRNKPPDSRVPFRFTNIQNQDVLMVKVADWNQHEIH